MNIPGVICLHTLSLFGFTLSLSLSIYLCLLLSLSLSLTLSVSLFQPHAGKKKLCFEPGSKSQLHLSYLIFLLISLLWSVKPCCNTHTDIHTYIISAFQSHPTITLCSIVSTNRRYFFWFRLSSCPPDLSDLSQAASVNQSRIQLWPGSSANVHEWKHAEHEEL